VHADFVTGEYFSMLGIETPLGRALTPDDDTPGRRRWRSQSRLLAAALCRPTRR